MRSSSENISGTPPFHATGRRKKNATMKRSPLYMGSRTGSTPLSPPPQELSMYHRSSSYISMEEEKTPEAIRNASIRSSSSNGSEKDRRKVDSLGVAFLKAKWPFWSKVALCMWGLATLLAICVLLTSRSWEQPAPALTFLQHSLCPLYALYREDTVAPFTTWLSTCKVAHPGALLACNTTQDCWLSGSSCASTPVRKALVCRSSDGTNGGEEAAPSLHSSTLPSMYCQLPISSPIESSVDSVSYSPFCFPPTSFCGLYRGDAPTTERLVACVKEEECQEGSAWLCVI